MLGESRQVRGAQPHCQAAGELGQMTPCLWESVSSFANGWLHPSSHDWASDLDEVAVTTEGLGSRQAAGSARCRCTPQLRRCCGLGLGELRAGPPHGAGGAA